MRRAAASAALIALAAGGCAILPKQNVRNAVSPAPHETWTPPPAARMPPSPDPAPPQLPEEYTKPGTTLKLGQLVDVALRNNPATRESWFIARAAAAEVGTRRAQYFPYAEAVGSIQRQKTSEVNNQFNFIQTTYGPSMAVSWLLFNFGAREAEVQEATRFLYAADWLHNASIQDVVLETSQGYYRYLNAKAQVVARKANLEEARRNLAAADERHKAGVATIADVLQARTAASQAELALQVVEGQVQIVRGALATTIGVPATIPVDVGELPEELPLDAVQQNVDQLIARAVEERPDLAAQRFRVLAAESRIHAAAVDGLPRLTLDALGNRTFYYTPNAHDPFSTNWAGAITLRIPVFRGFETAYEVQRAREEAEALRAGADRTENDVILDVWSSYYGLQTAAQAVRTTRDLLASALQSAEVADGRYRAGVGSILDLLTAQSALADARSQEAQARSLWFLAMAQLAHATGALTPGGNVIPRMSEASTGGAP